MKTAKVTWNKKEKQYELDNKQISFHDVLSFRTKKLAINWCRKHPEWQQNCIGRIGTRFINVWGIVLFEAGFENNEILLKEGYI